MFTVPEVILWSWWLPDWSP